MATYKGIGVDFAPDVLDSLDEFATAHNMTRAEVIRASVNLGLPMMRLGIALNGQRALTILEHTELSLSRLMEREFPEDSREIINQAIANVREYHG
ncbi:MAG: hypothetical protein AAF127_00190 [Pseudomonadota bacterium]